MPLSTSRRSAWEKGVLRVTGDPNLRRQPAMVRETRMDRRFWRTSGKKGSSCRQMPDKYELTDLGLM
jgi:hypothetical protein